MSIARYLLSKGASREKALERLSEISEEKHKLVSQFFEDMKRLEELEEALTAERKQLEADLAGPWSGQAKETLPTTCKGIKVSGLRKMEARVEALCLEGLFQEDRSYADGTVCKGTRDFDQLTTTDVVYGYVKSKEVTGIKRLADCPELVDPTDIGIPSLFISHAWKGGFSKLCKEIYAHMKKHELSEEIIVWLDVLAVNQHGGPDGNDFSREQNRADVAAFQDVLKTCMGGTVVVCDFAKCDTTTRCWCLYE